MKICSVAINNKFGVSVYLTTLFGSPICSSDKNCKKGVIIDGYKPFHIWVLLEKSIFDEKLKVSCHWMNK